MKVLLISANTEQISMPTIPLGLASVAEAAKNDGHDVTLLDLMVEADADGALKRVLTEYIPQCIGVSVRNIDDQNCQNPQFLIEKVKNVVAICRDLSQAPIVLGGAGYSMFPESALAYLGADFGIEGEGEIAFPSLLARLQNKDDLSNIPGLYSRDHGQHQQKIFGEDLDQLALPETSILSTSVSKRQGSWIPVQTRRGCALKCSYCSTSNIEGSDLRKRSPERVAAWIESWVKVGCTKFFFVDNTFNLPISYAKTLCRQIIEIGLDIRWRCIIYPKNIDEELVELMARAGCIQISLGFESGSEQILKNLNKQFSLDDVRAASTMFADHGIERMGFLLLGGPGETKESVEESLAFADSLKLDALRLSAGIRIYPDTQLAEIAKEQGVIFSTKSNLLKPHFYIAQGLEHWLYERLKDWQKSRHYASF